jgi:hypothetical protein
MGGVVRVSLHNFAFVHGTIFSLARTNDEAAQQERRRMEPHEWRIRIEKDGLVHDNLSPSLLWAAKPPAASNMLSIHTDCLPAL